MRFILICGTLMFLGSLLLLKTSFANLKIEQNGIFVKMRIDKLPGSCVGTKIKHFATFYYEGTNYIKRIPAGYCEEHHIGEFVDMKYLDGETEIFFPNESQKRELLFNIILCFFGLFTIIYSIARRKKDKK